MANLAESYRNLGKMTEAEELEVVVLEQRIQLFGVDHPDTVSAREDLEIIRKEMQNSNHNV
jgi:hypothetical protein